MVNCHLLFKQLIYKMHVWKLQRITFCMEFKLRKCYFLRKFNEKKSITLRPVAFHFLYSFCRSGMGFDWQKILSRCGLLIWGGYRGWALRKRPTLSQRPPLPPPPSQCPTPIQGPAEKIVNAPPSEVRHHSQKVLSCLYWLKNNNEKFPTLTSGAPSICQFGVGR